MLRAGIEFRLPPGWKTYWRYPGDSGVPPRFDFSGSRNVKDVRVLWPAPIRFADGGGNSVGYTTDFMLPLHVTPFNVAQPTILRVKLDYAVCEKLCVPADAALELALSKTATAHERSLRAGEARVPQQAELGASGPFAITGVRREHGAPDRVIVELRAPNEVSADLFAEGPTPQWSLPLPVPVPGAPAGLRRFAFELDGLPPGALARGAVLTLTAVSASAAIEVPVTLD